MSRIWSTNVFLIFNYKRGEFRKKQKKLKMLKNLLEAFFTKKICCREFDLCLEDVLTSTCKCNKPTGNTRKNEFISLWYITFT
jgi:hypothetical protein